MDIGIPCLPYTGQRERDRQNKRERGGWTQVHPHLPYTEVREREDGHRYSLLPLHWRDRERETHTQNKRFPIDSLYFDCNRVHTLKGHSRRVQSIASNPSGKLVASASWDCTIRVWNVAKGECVCDLKVGR